MSKGIGADNANNGFAKSQNCQKLLALQKVSEIEAICEELFSEKEGQNQRKIVDWKNRKGKRNQSGC